MHLFTMEKYARQNKKIDWVEHRERKVATSVRL